MGTGERASGGKTAIGAWETAVAWGVANGTIVGAWIRCPGGRPSDVSGGA